MSLVTNPVPLIRRLVAVAVALGLLTALMGAPNLARNARPGSAATPSDAGPVGSWRLTVVGIPGFPAFPVVVSYHADGTAASIGLPSQPAAPGSPNALVFNATGVGSWVATGPNASAFSFDVLNADEQGRYLGRLTVTGTQRLSDDGTTLTTEQVLTVTDPDGKVLASFPATATGTRIDAVPVAGAASVSGAPEADLAALTGSITGDGSATLAPAIRAAAEDFTAQAVNVGITIEASSSGQGITRFCAGELDLATSGRRIKDAEAGDCGAAGVAYDEFAVAFDGIAVVANPANAFAECLTVDQLGQLWAPGSTVRTWADLDPAWPAEPIVLTGTGATSGTYQFFTQQTVGEEGSSRDDYTVTDGHPATADAVAADANGLGFLPFPRYVENAERLKLVAVDGGAGCVAPSPETIRDGTYAPLARSLYLYTKRESLGHPEIAAFLRFYLADAAGFAERAGLVASPAETDAANRDRLEAALTGSTPPDGPATSAPNSLRAVSPRIGPVNVD